MEYKCSNCGNDKYKTIENQGGIFLICQNCGYVDELISRKESQSIQPEKKTNTVTCPYCKSSNVKKITNTSKAVHTALFGVFSMGRNSKNYHCNNCNSDF